MFKHIRIRTQLTILIGFLSLLLLGVGGLGLYHLYKANEALRDLYFQRVVPLGQLDTATRLMTRSQLEVTLGLTGDPAAASAEMDGVERNIARVNQLWGAYRSGPMSAEERALGDRFEAARTRFINDGLKPGMAAVRAQDQFKATEIVHGQLMTLIVPVSAGINALLKYITDAGNQQYEHSQQTFVVVRALLIGATLCGIALALVLGLTLVRAITGPLGQAVALAQRVAAGDLTQTVEIGAQNETGRLLAALSDMNASLTAIVGQVRGATDTIATAASEIASGNQDLSARTEQQAAALEETASSMEELTSMVRMNKDNAVLANNLALSASSTASRGGAVVAEVVETMGAISASACKIVDIIAVIDGIAFQTNILALNAAVEAARAGEQGRGFAVVASEVRNLAQRSAAAAREIKVLINNSVEKVDAGSALVGRAGETMNEIVASVGKVTAIMRDIAAASQEQGDGIEQVGRSLAQMDQVTQQNAALVEEAAAAAEAMRAQAVSLARAVSVFRLERAPRRLPAVARVAALRVGTAAGA